MMSVYLQGRSWAHRVPAGWKLALFAIFSLVLFQVGQIWIFGVALAAVLLAYASLGRPGLSRLKVVRALRFFIAVLLLIHWYNGTVMEGVFAVLRLLTMILAANFVSITTRMDDMLQAVEPLFLPLKWVGLSQRKPAMSVALVLRFVPYLLQVYTVLQDAFQARTGRRYSWRLVAPLAIQSLRMSDHVAEALSARGGAEGLSRLS